jgi:succinate dehydrogenase / fumarate reductase membrane anchor subunit
MAAGVVLFFLLGLHMLIMHTSGTMHLFAPHAGDSVSVENSMFRDGKMAFTVTYVLLLAVGLYHGLYGLRTILFELSLKPVVEKVITGVLVVVGAALLGMGTWAAFAAHAVALGGAKG